MCGAPLFSILLFFLKVYISEKLVLSIPTLDFVFLIFGHFFRFFEHCAMSLNVLLHSNQTRAAIQRKLVVRQSRTAVYGDRLLVHQGTRLHNSLPEHIRNSDTVEKFKYEITKYFKQETHIQRAVQFFN